MTYDQLANTKNEDLYTALVDIMHELHHRFKAHKGATYERWLLHVHPQIVMALNQDHAYLGKQAFTMEDLVKDLTDEVNAQHLILAQLDAESNV